MHKVVLGVTGGIAAYKAAELARIFIRGGSEVQVVMTKAATEFIAPLTFQTLTGRPAFTAMFSERSEAKIRHIDLVEEADLLVIAPASANTIAKLAGGLADNLLATLYLASTCPVVIVPSMNVNMFDHPAVRDNLEKLKSRGCYVMDPDAGELACGVYGKGRMPEPNDIYHFCRQIFLPRDFKDLTALVTAGPTREPLDPVRFISNPSSGLMGYALARALQQRGAAVTLVSGPTHLAPPAGVETVRVNTAAEMYDAVMERYSAADLVIKAAAVSDFRPREQEPRKVKKKEAGLSLNLEPTRDILAELGRTKNKQLLIGFAAETGNAVAYGQDKLQRKNLDLIVVNDIGEPGAGFAHSTNRVTIIDRHGVVEELPLMEKEELAGVILDRIKQFRQE